MPNLAQLQQYMGLPFENETFQMKSNLAEILRASVHTPLPPRKLCRPLWSTNGREKVQISQRIFGSSAPYFVFETTTTLKS